MYAQVEKTKESKNSAVANSVAQKKSDRLPSFGFVDNRPEVVIQKRPQEIANNTPHAERATQSQAYAYTQGSNIHIPTGQGKHLPHEACHVVQQKQESVKTTMQMKGGVNVNDNKELDNEADVIGLKVPEFKQKGLETERKHLNPIHYLNYKNTLFKVNKHRSIQNSDSLIQRKIIIEGHIYTHASYQIYSLLNKVTLLLDEKGLKTYGVQAKLRQFIKNYRRIPKAFETFDDFWSEFFLWLEKQERRVKGGKTTKAIKPFKVDLMHRINWPEKLKKSKGYVKGEDNIRHVIRNRTLIRALDTYHNKIAFSTVNTKRYTYEMMSQSLRIPTRENQAIDRLIHAIYKKLYLNPLNLFSGPGPYNQIIGFLSDPLVAYGHRLVKRDEQIKKERVREIYLEVRKLVGHTIVEKRKMIRANDDQIKKIISDIIAVITNDFNHLQNLDTEEFEPMEVGTFIENIGANLGFDLIDGRVAEDQEYIGERQRSLFEVEQALQTYITSNGVQGNLEHILKHFLNILNNDSENSQIDSHDSDHGDDHSGNDNFSDLEGDGHLDDDSSQEEKNDLLRHIQYNGLEKYLLPKLKWDLSNDEINLQDWVKNTKNEDIVKEIREAEEDKKLHENNEEQTDGALDVSKNQRNILGTRTAHAIPANGYCLYASIARTTGTPLSFLLRFMQYWVNEVYDENGHVRQNADRNIFQRFERSVDYIAGNSQDERRQLMRNMVLQPGGYWNNQGYDAMVAIIANVTGLSFSIIDVNANILNFNGDNNSYIVQVQIGGGGPLHYIATSQN